MTKHFLLLFVLLGVASSLSAQKAERKHIREGNKQYKEQKVCSYSRYGRGFLRFIVQRSGTPKRRYLSMLIEIHYNK